LLINTGYIEEIFAIDVEMRMTSRPDGLDEFIDCVEDVQLSESFVDKYVTLDEKNYKRGLIFQNWMLSVYVISWMPGHEGPMQRENEGFRLWVCA
jgi:hypothetical protein